jgi:hypothetical protein
MRKPRLHAHLSLEEEAESVKSPMQIVQIFVRLRRAAGNSESPRLERFPASVCVAAENEAERCQASLFQARSPEKEKTNEKDE